MKTTTTLATRIATVGLGLSAALSLASTAALAAPPVEECGDLLLLAKFESKFGNTQIGDEFAQDGVVITITDVKEGEAMGFDWTSQVPVDMVVVKAGNGTEGVAMDEATEGTMAIEDQQAISHVTFCYDEDESGDEPTEPERPTEPEQPTEPETPEVPETPQIPQAPEVPQDQTEVLPNVVAAPAPAPTLPTTGAGHVALALAGSGLIGSGGLLLGRTRRRA